MKHSNDEVAAYLNGLIEAVKKEQALVDGATAAVTSQTERLRQVMAVLEENEATRQALFDWIAERNPNLRKRQEVTVKFESTHGSEATWPELGASEVVDAFDRAAISDTNQSGRGNSVAPPSFLSRIRN